MANTNIPYSFHSAFGEIMLGCLISCPRNTLLVVQMAVKEKVNHVSFSVHVKTVSSPKRMVANRVNLMGGFIKRLFMGE